MNYSGTQNYRLHKANNFSHECLSVMPTWDETQIGRTFIFVVPGSDFGLYFGGPSGWVRVGENVAYAFQVYDFRFWDLDTTDINQKPVYELAGITTEIPVPAFSEIIMLSLRSSLPITSGEVIGKPTINGVPVGDSSLDTVLNTTNPEFNRAFLSSENPMFKLSSSGNVGICISGSVDCLPTLIDVLAYLYVKVPVLLNQNDISDTVEFSRYAFMNSVSAQLYTTGGMFPGVRASKGGYILGINAVLNPIRTSGTIYVIPTINSIPIVDTRLNLLFDQFNPQYRNSYVLKDAEFKFNSGDLLGLLLVSDALAGPTMNILATMNLVYE